MVLVPGKAEALWETVSKFRTLFSDFNPGDLAMWVSMLTDQDSVWIEICEGQKLVVLCTFKGLTSQVIDAECHFLALDRMPAEKVEVVRKVIAWIFTEYPMLHRITMSPPTLYYAAIRAALKIGFIHEGIKRETVLIRGRWASQAIMGILRREAPCQ